MNSNCITEQSHKIMHNTKNFIDQKQITSTPPILQNYNHLYLVPSLGTDSKLLQLTFQPILADYILITKVFNLTTFGLNYIKMVIKRPYKHKFLTKTLTYLFKTLTTLLGLD